MLIAIAAGLGNGQTAIDLRTQGRNVDFSGASSTRPSKTGTTLPGNCAVGETFFKTDAPAGKNQYGCTATNTWTLQGGDELPAQSGKANWVLTNDGTAPEWRALGGDIGGTPDAAVVESIQGRKVAPTAPGAGSVLTWNATTNAWEPTPGMSPVPNYAAVFSNATMVTVAGTAHGFNTANLIVSCYDDSLPPRQVEPDEVSIDPVTRDVAIQFSVPQTGYCVVNGEGGGSADPEAITLTGDVAGDPTTTTVTGLQNRPVSAMEPMAGQALVWNAADSEWQPQNIAAGEAGSTGTQAGDLNVERTSATVLTIGAGCTVATPCNVRFGQTVYSVKNGATATMAAGNGIVYIYVAPGGVITVGHNGSVSCSAGCTAVGGITAFPADAVPLFTWNAVDGLWEASGGSDQRAWLSARSINSGTGIVVSEVGAGTLVSVNTAIVPSYITGTAALDFAAIASGSCAPEQSFNVPGAMPGDAVAAGWPGGLEAGLLGMMRVNAADTIAVRLCNFGTASVDPASATFRATIVRGF